MLPASGVVYLLVDMSFEYTICENFKLQKKKIFLKDSTRIYPALL